MIARLLIGTIKNRLEKIQSFLKESELKNPHPDLLYFTFDSKLGITDARKIKEYFSLKPYSAKGRAVVLENGANLTDEAQNALLKTLEELPKEALFIIGADSESKFLPTILSRCEITYIPTPHIPTPDVDQIDTSGFSMDFEKLMDATIEERFEYIEKLKDREEFLHCLVNYFHKKLPLDARFAEELLQAERWQKQNVNLRAILEYLMLVMPQKS